MTSASLQGAHRSANRESLSCTWGRSWFPSLKVTVISFSAIKSRLGIWVGMGLSPMTISLNEIFGVASLLARDWEPVALSGGFSVCRGVERYAVKMTPSIEQDVLWGAILEVGRRFLELFLRLLLN